MTILILTTLLGIAICALALATLCSRLRKENERLRDELLEADLKRQRIVDPLITDKRRLERELEQAQKDLYREREYYVDQINCIQCPDRFETTDYGTSFRVSAVGNGKRPLCVGYIHEYEYIQGDRASRKYAWRLTVELIDKLKEKAI